ncbi:MAG: hypothetical protein Q4G48_04240 [Bacteroidia bacterium]|nr:hypothetical protein [Bacteroidia bacterium]
MLPSCLHPQPEAPQLLEQAEALMESHPDSAMLLIDSIFYPEESLHKADYMRYLVARVQARYKNYRPVAEDTLIFVARDYFTKHSQNPKQTTLAYFYSGCVYREQDNFGKAMQHYKDAEQYAVKTQDVDLQVLVQYNMGDLLAEEGLHAQALKKYQEAENLYRQSPVQYQEKQARCLAAIGRMFLLLGEEDSSFVAFHKGLELAETSGNNDLQSILAQNLSVAYMEAKQYAQAKEYLHQSMKFNLDSTKLPRYYLNFANLYFEIQQSDSLYSYAQKLKQAVEYAPDDDPSLKASAYSFLADFAKSQGDFDEAFQYLNKRSRLVEEITQKQLKRNVYETQQKYDYQKQQSRHTQALLKRQRLGIFFLTLFLAASLAAIVLLRKTVYQKKRLLSLQNAMQTLYKTAKDLRQQQEVTKESHVQLREILLWKFNVQHKSALLKSELQHLDRMDTKKAFARFDEIVYGKDNPSQWSSLVETIDELTPGLSGFIRRRYPQFSDTEFNVCLLSYAGLNAKETALMLNQSPHTVNMARTRIRQKMNLTEPGADFCAAIDKAYRQYHEIK